MGRRRERLLNAIVNPTHRPWGQRDRTSDIRSCQMVQVDPQRPGKLLERCDSALLVSCLDSRNHRAGHLGGLRQAFLGEFAMLAPDSHRALPGKTPLGDFQRYQLILAALKARLRRVKGFNVRKHLGIVHELLESIHRQYRELLAVADDFFYAHQYIPPLGPTSSTSITRRSSSNS